MRIYFMSICGTGMGNAALLMREAGHEVIGADENTYPPMSEWLAQAGIRILNGYDVARLQELRPDLVVVGNVNSRGNPEVEWLLQSRSIPFTSLPAVLSSLLLSFRRNIVVTGTHGKTTTTCLTAYLLRANGRDPGYLIGGVPNDLPGGARLGAGSDPFVIEGDEYDSAFFDKRSKFIHYQPHILAINNLEFDHADIFRDLEDVKRSFRHLLRVVPGDGKVLANADDPNVCSLLDFDWTEIIRVGAGQDADLRIAGFKESQEGSEFQLFWRGRHWADVKWKLWGLYNARNAAMAALAAGLSIYPEDPVQLDLSALSGFIGVRRRQECLYDAGDLTILTDFGHHPTAIRQTLESLRYRFPGRRLIACFEARSNTACRKILEPEFEGALSVADRIHLGPVYRSGRYAEAERLSPQGIAHRIGPRASAYSDNAQLGEAVAEELLADSPAVVCFFSNGSFDGVPAKVAGCVRIRAEV